MLLDELPERDHLFLGLGTMQAGADPVVLCFHVVDDGAGWVRAEQVEPLIVEDDSVQVVSRIGEGRLEPLARLLAAAPPAAAMPTAPHPAGKRILDELEEIRVRYSAQVIEWAAPDGQLAAIIRKGSRELVAVFPPEYPLGAPQIIVGGLGSGPSSMVPLRYGWSSLHRLVDVVGEGLEPSASDATTPLTGPLDPLERAALGLFRRFVLTLSRVLGPREPKTHRRPS
jgi:hypothetical protein